MSSRVQSNSREIIDHCSWMFSCNKSELMSKMLKRIEKVYYNSEVVVEDEEYTHNDDI